MLGALGGVVGVLYIKKNISITLPTTALRAGLKTHPRTEASPRTHGAHPPITGSHPKAEPQRDAPSHVRRVGHTKQ